MSNLANSLHDKQKDQFVEHFQAIIDTLEEHYTPAVTLAKHAAFRLGMADISMLHIADAALILTQDAGFASRVNRSGNGLALDLKAAAALRRDL